VGRQRGLLVTVLLPKALAIMRPALFPTLLCSVALALAGAARAQAVAAPAEPVASDAPMVDFAADQLTYEENTDIVLATGNVVVNRDGATLTADRVRYNRKTAEVTAEGNVLVVDAAGNKALGDKVVLTDTLRDGVVENILLVLTDGGRLAAANGTRVNERTTLNRAVYSPCAVVDEHGCPVDPVWSIKALRIVHDPATGRISYRQARLEMFGIPLLSLPRLSHPDNFDRNQSGFLGPDIRFNRYLGAELSLPWFISFGPNRDLTVTPYLYSAVNPVLGAQYRHLFAAGPIEISGRITYARGQAFAGNGIDFVDTAREIRGYAEARGQLNHGNGWRSTFTGRVATDDNFLGRYQISYDDRLRSTWNLEHFGGESYFSVQGWAFQGLRATDRAATTPLALPLIDFRWRPDIDPLGGRLLVEANSLTIHRAQGQSIFRGLASTRWDRGWITPLGQRVTITGLLRGDIYAGRSRCRMAAGRAVCRRHANAHPAHPACRQPCRRQRQHPQRGFARGRSGGYQPVRLQPLSRLRPLGRWRAADVWLHLDVEPARRAGDSADRPELSVWPCRRAVSRWHGAFGPVFRSGRPVQRARGQPAGGDAADTAG
jgi:LPS-assembly protein